METVVIETKLGKIRGKVASDYLGGKYYSFQGIPYAKAPVGNLRFKAPVPVEPWTTELNATKEGPECPSSHMMFQTYLGKEDNCLNLNVFIKEMPTLAKPPRPVMVYIHGGGFIQGSNRSEFFGPDYLMTEDVIQVTINYRLGILGFLSLEDDSLGVTGNAGLKDQNLALKWVKNNIGHFGGDPNNVTIYGESAGSASVHYHILSPQSKGLFQRAILQSGSALNVWASGQRGTADIVKHLCIKETDEKKILEILQKTCPKKLVNAQMKAPELFIPSKKRCYGPVVENPSPDAFLTEEPVKLLKSGNFNKVPIMIGATTNEGLLYELVRKIKHVKGPLDYEMEIPYELGVPPKSEVAALLGEKIRKYYKSDEGSSEDRLNAVYRLKSDHHFVHGIHRTVRYHLEDNNNPVYYYLFAFEGEYNYFKKFAASKSMVLYFLCHYFIGSSDREFIKNIFAKIGNSMGFNKMVGCCHADDLGYLFKAFYSHKVDPECREAKTLQRMVKMWTNFAKYGNPTPESGDDSLGVTWKSAEKGNLQCLNIGDELSMIDGLFKERNAFWDEIFRDYAKN